MLTKTGMVECFRAKLREYLAQPGSPELLSMMITAASLTQQGSSLDYEDIAAIIAFETGKDLSYLYQGTWLSSYQRTFELLTGPAVERTKSTEPEKEEGLMDTYKIQFPIVVEAELRFDGSGKEALSYLKKRVRPTLHGANGVKDLSKNNQNNDAIGIIALRSFSYTTPDDDRNKPFNELLFIESCEPLKYKCEDCLLVWDTQDLRPISNLLQRVLPGEIMPYGECASCGSLCYADKSE